ncbi:unnamed protein product [Rotaria magnacalcarata]|uniref:Nuclear receptor domain-containing protein n=2 Tax=Rotaria magnacalcarata TaxID=392030 RepID=A0A816LKQ1_9BILA|nr:unnamed protein product [Rotaria magnacalcarata]CAF1977139.1 unnamed protein product [Rotaria magnacalcarata]
MSMNRVKHTKNDLQDENNERSGRKRSFSSIAPEKGNQKSRGPMVKRYKTILTCVVCHGDAHGYNFDAISCESCKAFFRRNALRSLEKLKCRGTGSCDVAFNVRKRCKICRLQKCFKCGMRKEWILSDKEKAEKLAKIEENRRLKQINDSNQQNRCSEKNNFKNEDDRSLVLSPFINEPILNDFDWFSIQFIQDCFVEAVRLNQISGIPYYPATKSIESTVDLFRIPLYISAMRLITYIKQINEFQQLDKEDQVYLVKLNLLTICFLHSIFIYDPSTDSYHEQDTTDPVVSGKDWNKTLNREFHIEMKQIRNDLIDIFQSDDIVIKLFYLILIFSNQMSLNQSIQCLKTRNSSLSIFKGQNVFTDLVYRYCLHQCGFDQAPILFLRYVNKLMKIQKLVDKIKHTINNYIDIGELSLLMQSLLM